LPEQFDAFTASAPAGSLYNTIDGDADRLAVWTKKKAGGVLSVAPNDLGVMYGVKKITDMFENGEFGEGATYYIAKTQPTTSGMDFMVAWANAEAKRRGVNVKFEIHITPVGSKNFANDYLGGKLIIGVEESGHIVMKDFFDDAVGQLHFLLKTLADSGKTLEEAIFEAKKAIGDAVGEDLNSWVYERINPDMTPEFSANFREKIDKGDLEPVMEQLRAVLGEKADDIRDVRMTTLNPDQSTGDISYNAFTALKEQGAPLPVLKKDEGVIVFMKDGSWFMVRVSGTEGVVRLYAEARSGNIVKEYQRAVAQAFSLKVDSAMSEGNGAYEEEWGRPVSEALRGGIDFNIGDGLTAEGVTIDLKFDPEMVEQFRQGDFTGITPIITNISPIQGWAPILGRKSRAEGTE